MRPGEYTVRIRRKLHATRLCEAIEEAELRILEIAEALECYDGLIEYISHVTLQYSPPPPDV